MAKHYNGDLQRNALASFVILACFGRREQSPGGSIAFCSKEARGEKL